MNNRFVCYYSVLRFAPYRETEEFANVGIILACPSAGFLDYRAEAKRFGRISNFFPEMDISIFQASLRSFRASLDQFATREEDGQQIHDTEKARVKNLFREIVRPRESMLYFSDVKVARSFNPSETLDFLFADYVERRFAATTEYKETVMKRNLEALLRDHRLLDRFARDERVGTKLFNVRLPFVRYEFIDDTPGAPTRPAAAIKPIDLSKDDPTAIIKHADSWRANISRLRQFDAAPDHVLFTVGTPPDGSDARQAYGRVIEDFRVMNITVLSESDQNGVLEFAGRV